MGFAFIAWGSGLLVRLPQFTHPPAAELCDNALDDDGDSLIDLNDPDCACAIAKPESLIPNPSFEDKNCCPQTRSELNCAKTWIQASEATTDYLHTCGWIGWGNMPPPQPFPDGDGCVGFRNGRYASGRAPNWKEYAGACLSAPMKAGTTYLIRFYVGFTGAQHSPPLDVMFYGTPDCRFLPFGVGNPDYGCPMNGPGWMELGKVYVSGVNEWVKTEIQITPSVDIYAIAIGPNCQPVNTQFDTYYFLDHLVLADEREFGYAISASGNPCSDTFSLKTIRLPDRKYQWYKDGIALLGETSPELRVKTGDGDYQVRISEPGGCRITEAFLFRKPFTQTTRSAYLCPETAYTFHNRRLARPGIYVDTLKSKQGCDSLIRLNLIAAPESGDTVNARLFPGETISVGSKKITQPGRYFVTLTSSIGCDSLVMIDAAWYKVFMPTAFSPNGDGLNDRFIILGGADLLLIRSLQIYDRWGGLVYQGQDLPPEPNGSGWDGTYTGKPLPPGLYVFQAILLMDDGKERRVSGQLALVR